MDTQKLCRINAIATGLIGFVVLSMFLFNEPEKFLINLLIFPISFIITKVFLKCKLNNLFVGFLTGGIFASVGTSIVMVLLSIHGDAIFISYKLNFLVGIFWAVAIIASLIVGGTSGLIITIIKRKYIKSLSE